MKYTFNPSICYVTSLLKASGHFPQKKPTTQWFQDFTLFAKELWNSYSLELDDLSQKHFKSKHVGDKTRQLSLWFKSKLAQNKLKTEPNKSLPFETEELNGQILE